MSRYSVSISFHVWWIDFLGRTNFNPWLILDTLDRVEIISWNIIIVKKDLYLNKRMLDSRDIIIFFISFFFFLYQHRLIYVSASPDICRGYVSFTSLFHFHTYTRLASFPQRFANSFENVGFLSNYLTSKLDSVSLSRLSARNWHNSVTMRANSSPICVLYIWKRERSVKRYLYKYREKCKCKIRGKPV